jgi:hypothetical protein
MIIDISCEESRYQPDILHIADVVMSGHRRQPDKHIIIVQRPYSLSLAREGESSSCSNPYRTDTHPLLTTTTTGRNRPERRIECWGSGYAEKLRLLRDVRQRLCYSYQKKTKIKGGPVMKKSAGVLISIVLIVSLASFGFAAESQKGTIRSVDAGAGTITFCPEGSNKDIQLKADKSVDLTRIKPDTKAEITVDKDTVKDVKEMKKPKAAVGC